MSGLRGTPWVWLPPVGWATAILIAPWFVAPTLPASGSESILDGTTVLRSGIHAFEYAILALLFLRLLNRSEAWSAIFADQSQRGSRLYSLAFLITAGYAILDEAHQGFIPNRVPSIEDFLADSVGILLALGTVAVLARSHSVGPGDAPKP